MNAWHIEVSGWLSLWQLKKPKYLFSQFLDLTSENTLPHSTLANKLPGQYQHLHHCYNDHFHILFSVCKLLFQLRFSTNSRFT